jgi:peptidoglycan/LPS O-acetylase OafA/YrhL
MFGLTTTSNQSAEPERICVGHDSNKKDQLSFVNGIKGFAALTVIFFHGFLLFLKNDQPSHWTISKTPLVWIREGPFSVQLFFVIAGFVLSFRYYQDGQVEHLVSMLSRRYLRLAWPVFHANVLYFFARRFKLFNAAIEAQLRVPQPARSQFVESMSNIVPVQQFFGEIESFIWVGSGSGIYSWTNGVEWTLHIEFLGAFLTACICLMTRHVRTPAVIFISTQIILLAPFAKDIGGLIPSRLQFSGFVFGCIISWLHSNSVLVVQTSKIGRWASLLTCFIGLCVGLTPWTLEKNERNCWNSLGSSIFGTIFPQDSHFVVDVIQKSVGAAIFFGSCLISPEARLFFGNRLFCFFGRISFSLYLLHFLVLLSVSSLAYCKLLDAKFDAVSSGVFCIASGLITLIPSCFLFTKFVDERSDVRIKWMYNQYLSLNPEKNNSTLTWNFEFTVVVIEMFVFIYCQIDN